MSRTKSDIADYAARILKLVSTSQSATGADNAILLRSVEHCHAELGHHGIAWWPIDETPEAAASSFAQYVAGDAAEQLVGEERAVAFENKMPRAMRRMTAVVAKGDYSDQPVRFNDF